MQNHARILFLAAPSLAKGSLPAGARWITVHPNGPGEKGTPVLIQQQSDGSARVIGGAGGKLNYLRLTGVRSETDYREEARKKDAGRRAEKKARRDQDRKDGLLESKTKAKKSVQDKVSAHQREFVKTVAQAMGWDDKELEFPAHEHQNLSESARRQAERRHHQELFRKAQEAVDTQRKMLVQDAEARSAAGLGEVKLTSSAPDELSVQDLVPVPETSASLGFQAGYGKRAEAAGLTPEELKAETAAAKPPPKNPPKEGEAPAAEKRKATAEKIAEELKTIREPGPKVDPKKVVDARQAVELLKAEKKLKALQKSAREQVKKIEGAKEVVEPNAYVLEVGNSAVESDVVKDLENDLRTLKTRAFLEAVGRVAGGTESLGKHIGVGAYNSINSVALAAGGSSMVDRSVVDVLGVAGAAQVLARRLGSDLTAEELEHVRQAMGTYHVDHYMRLSDQALREARELHEVAHEIDVGEAKNGADLRVAQELNAKRREFVEAAQRTLGTALGEMEANAALVVALDQPKKDQITVSLGKTGIEEAIRQARAIGLERGDYQIERVGATTMLTVHAAGMDKLAQPVSKEDLERTRTSLAIINGEHDEDDWLPEGVARRPDMAMDIKPGAAPRLAKPFPDQPSDIEGAIRSYIGGRVADGDAPADVMAGLLSEDTLQRAGDRQAFMAALERIAPLYGDDGKMIRVEAHQAAFESMADNFVAQLGGDRTPLHRQKFDVDDVAVDALHRALAEHPDGVAAFKPVGELTVQDQRALREAFVREFGRSDPQADQLRQDLEKLEANEPEREVEDMFGRGVNPAWTEWQGRRNELAAKVNAATMDWGKYVQTMGSPANAYAAMQDVVKSQVLRAFADHHNRLKPGAPLKVGRTVVANDLNHLDALDADARERRLAQHRDLVDSLRNRVAGRYASGAVSDKIAAARAAQEAEAQAQMGFFGAMEQPSHAADEAAPAERPLELGERFTLGHVAERQVAGMMPEVGRNFRAGQPVKLWQPTMSGRFVGRQRAIKLIEHNRRVMLAQGVGSGKTSMMLAGFTHLHAKGKAKRGLFVVPSIVQGQFHGEALTLLKPNAYNWHCDTGASREERIAAYKDPNVHFSVVTHQAFRDDLLHLASQREGTTPEAVAEKLDGMAPRERKTYMRELLDAEGIDHDYLAIDEGHNLLNRQGKANSRMANVIDAVSHGVPNYVNATADPVKNDPSEAFDVLSKMDPDRYHDRDAFMRRYGVNTAASKDALRREMARHFYPGRIESGVRAAKTEVQVQLTDGQREHLAKLDDAVARARLARMRGSVDVEAVKTLSPSSFGEVPEAQHQELARHLQANVGIIHGTAVQHAINGESKVEALAKTAGERRGRPGVVFVNRLDRVQEIAERLKKEGHRVVTLTGGDTSADKDRKKREYQRGDHDIIVCSNAGAVGANLQRGKWLAQFDTPMTAMVHAQRNGRIDRVGQTEDVELLDLVADHPAERRARKRLADKYELRDIMTSPLEGLDDHGVAGYLQRARANQLEEAQPHFVPAAPHQVPAGLAPPEPQSSLF